MSIELSLSFSDESLDGPNFSRAFREEVIFSGHIDFSTVLNQEEEKILQPNEEGSIVVGQKKSFKKRHQLKLWGLLLKLLKGKESQQQLNKFLDEFSNNSELLEDRERDPQALKAALQKVEQAFIQQSAQLPLVHLVYEDPECQEEVYGVEIEGITAHVEGDLFFYEHYETALRGNIWVKSYLEDYGKIDLKIPVAPEIQINQQTYYTKTITKAEQFAPEFQAFYDFLELAIAQHKKVLWEWW